MKESPDSSSHRALSLTYLEHLLSLLSSEVVFGADAQVVLVVLTVHVFMDGLKTHTHTTYFTCQTGNFLQ